MKKKSNFFEDSAGPEELKHLDGLLDELTDEELASLSRRVGIKFLNPKKATRRDYEITMTESDREVFYREYAKIIQERKTKG
jgi:hypothetical protein